MFCVTPGCPLAKRSILRRCGLVLLVMLGQTALGSAQPETLDRILAVVAGHVIMHSDVRAFVSLGLAELDAGADPEAAMLTHLIERRLILDEVDRYVVGDPPPASVERRLAQVEARCSSPQAFAAVLDRVGFTNDDLRQVLRDSARRDAYVANRFDAVSIPTDAQLREYYDEHAAELAGEGRRSFAEARPLVLQRLTNERRAETIADWVASLVRRGQVIRVPTRH